MKFGSLFAAMLALLALPSASAADSPTDYSGLGLNTKQLAAVRAVEARMDARDRASFEKLWAQAPASIKRSGYPKSVWFALYKWSITIGTVGECSRFLGASEVDSLRHVWDVAKGKSEMLDRLIEQGDRAYQAGDAAGNDRDAPDEQTCAVTLRSLQSSDAKAVAQLGADVSAQTPSK